MTPAAFWTVVVATAAAILSFDLLLPLGAAGGVPYVVLVLLALKSPSRNTALALAAIGSALTIVGFLLSEPGAPIWIVLTNRALALFVIWIILLPVVGYQRLRFGNVETRLDLSDFMNSVKEAIVISDDRAIILGINKAAEAMYGYRAKELVGKSAAILRPEPERSEHQRQIDNFVKTGLKVFVGKGPHLERGLRKDGSIFAMEMQLGELWQDGRHLFVGTTRDVSARVEAQDNQRQTQALFEKAFHASLQLASMARLSDGKVIDINETWLHTLGFERDEVIGRSARDLDIWIDLEQREELYETVQRTGKVHGFEATWRAKDGRHVEVLISVERLDVDGESAMLLVGQDQTDRKKTEAALRESEERFTKAFQAAPLMLSLMWLEDGRRIDVNDAWLKGLGYSREATVGRTSKEFPLWVSDERRTAAHKLMHETGSLRHFDAVWRKSDGSIIDVLLNAERLELDGKPAMLSIARDITEERRNENALRESEERFAKTFQGAPLMMCLMNLRNFEYLDANEAWLNGVGYRREDVIGQTSAEVPLWASEPERVEAHKTLRETGSLRGFETEWRKSDGTTMEVRIQSELLDIGGEPAILSIARDVTEEKHAEHALRESEARFRDVAEISSDWIWETDADNRISYISDRIRDTLGFDPEVVIGSVRGASDRIADKGSEAWQRHLEDVEDRRPFENFVYQHYDREGEIRHIQISGKPVFGEGGAFMGYRGLGADITRRREIEKARARAKQQREGARQRLQAVMDNVLEGIVTIDGDGIIESINPAGEGLFGYAGSDLIGQNVSLLMTGENSEKHDGYLAHYFRTGEERILAKPRELLARHRDGSEFPIELRVSEMHIGDSRKFVGAIRDLTEHKHGQEALRRSEEYLRAVIENSTDVISIVDADGMIRFESPAIEGISGLKRKELKGYHVADRAHYDDRAAVRAAFSRVVQEPARVETVEYRARDKSGGWHTIESIGKNMLDNPVINGVIITSRDITEHKQALVALQAAKEEAEHANRGKTEFLANMSHELRTPLNAIIGFAAMIEQEIYGPLSSDKYKNSASYIDESATHLLNLINDLLDVSKIEVGKMDMFAESIEVGPVIEQMLRMIEPRAAVAGVSLDMEGFDNLPGLYADLRMLKQIVLNLISNAVKFTPEGGLVTVRAYIDGQGAMAISVRDTGIGIAEADIPTALSAFGQIKGDLEAPSEGTGLGLPLSKSLIEMHGGEIGIESTVGVGTTVTIRYPANCVCLGVVSAESVQAKAS